MKRFILLFSLVVAMLRGGISLQAQPLQGRVLDAENRQSVAAATIFHSLSRLQLISDVQGKFQLPASISGGPLRITAVGYDTLHMSVADLRSAGNIALLQRSNKVLEEVQVTTGYETFEQRTATGAFEFIGPELLNRQVSMDIISRIDGLVSGLFFDPLTVDFDRVGESINPRLQLQGINRLRSLHDESFNPLIILDNFPYTGNINLINPNTIESITILKDAASAAIWGARAGNGVIVITSKSPKAGRLSVNFSSNWQLHAKPDLYAKRTMTSSDLIDMELFLYKQGFYDSKYNDSWKSPLSPIVDMSYEHALGKVSSTELEEAIAFYRTQDVRDDMLKYMFRNKFLRQYNLSIGGGNNVAKTLLSVGYDHSLQPRISDVIPRISIKLDNEIRFNYRLNMQVSANWVKQEPRLYNGAAYYSDYGYKFPYVSIADEHGQPLSIPWFYRDSYLKYAGEGKLLNWDYKPLDDVRQSNNKESKNELILNARLDYRLFDPLTLSLVYRFVNQNDRIDNLYSMESYEMRNSINLGTEIIGEVANYHYPLGGKRILKNRDGQGHNGRIQLNLAKDWAGQHSLRALAGMELSHMGRQTYGINMIGYNENQGVFQSGLDYSALYKSFDNLKGITRLPSPVDEFKSYVDRSVSVFFNGSYTFQGKHTASFSLRRDAANVFGATTNKRWTPLWSAGYSYLLHEEPFYTLGWLPQLKLRSSYGVSGNIDNSQTALATIFYRGDQSYYDFPYEAAAIKSMPNPSLRWEKVRQFNLGLDFALFSNRQFSGSLDFYYKRTADLLYNVPIDETYGLSKETRNIADTKSKGVNATLQAHILQGPLNWNVQINFAYNNNWLGKAHWKVTLLSDYFTETTILNKEGSMLYPLYSYRWAGLDHETGAPMGWLNGEPSMDYRALRDNNQPVENLKFHGSVRPLYFGAMRQYFRYKRWALSANIAYQFDFYYFRKGLDYGSFSNFYGGHADYSRRWQKPGDELHTDIPAFIYPINSNARYFYNFTEVLVERGDYIQLRDVRLDYKHKLRWQNTLIDLGLFAMLNNVGILWKASKSPDSPIYRGNIPPMRFLSFGLQLSY